MEKKGENTNNFANIQLYVIEVYIVSKHKVY